jgi:hypothetical protein
MKTIPFLEDLLFGSEILFCPCGIINKPTGWSHGFYSLFCQEIISFLFFDKQEIISFFDKQDHFFFNELLE